LIGPVVWIFATFESVERRTRSIDRNERGIGWYFVVDRNVGNENNPPPRPNCIGSIIPFFWPSYPNKCATKFNFSINKNHIQFSSYFLHPVYSQPRQAANKKTLFFLFREMPQHPWNRFNNNKQVYVMSV
jgi:hypothetical protein